MYFQFGGESYFKLGEGEDDFEDNMFDCSLLYFSSFLFSFVCKFD